MTEDMQLGCSVNLENIRQRCHFTFNTAEFCIPHKLNLHSLWEASTCLALLDSRQLLSPDIYHAPTFTSVFNSEHENFFPKGTQLLVVLKLSMTVFKTLHLLLYVQKWKFYFFAFTQKPSEWLSRDWKFENSKSKQCLPYKTMCQFKVLGNFRYSLTESHRQALNRSFCICEDKIKSP